MCFLVSFSNVFQKKKRTNESKGKGGDYNACAFFNVLVDIGGSGWFWVILDSSTFYYNRVLK